MDDGQALQDIGQLTVAILVRNDESLLGETLAGLQSLADKVIVLRASDPADAATAGHFPADSEGTTVLACPWADDFAAARNWLLEQLSGGWVLWLEPGERFECSDLPALRQLLSDEQNRTTVFRVVAEIPVDGPENDVEQAEQIRLIPVCSQLRYSGRVAESIEPAVMVHRFRVGTAPGKILGTIAGRSVPLRQRRAAEVLRLVELERSERGSVPLSALLAAGTAHADLKQPLRARDAFRQVARRAAAGTPRMLEAYYGLLAIGGDPADQSEQLAVCLEALRAFPFDAQLLCAMGNCLQQMNRFDLAAKSFEAAFRFGQVEPTCWHLREIKPLAAVCWSVCLQLQGQEEQASQVIEEALAAFPRSGRLQRRLLNLYVKNRRKDDALRIVAAMGLPSHQCDALRWAVRGACYAAEGRWPEALAWLKSAYAAECREPLCLRWLCVALLSNGQVEAAQPVLEQWLAAEPQNTEARTYWETLFGAQRSAEAEQPPAAAAGVPEPASGPSHERQFRLDPAASITQVLCPQSPVISQFSSIDSVSNPGPHIPSLPDGPVHTGAQPTIRGKQQS